ncbi:phenylalanine--tRNA ligase subunit beta [Terrilactibacillus sp. BCM23-1]|uniref:Phenylalanine--tRNA ligase beta subunit n=1 Tax=Terrilactibacillus tamarindi TaxID=2599694 RepID=A0A6N8CNX8_9BACI|nr:phenylalanine--tRNA ligase subunit beta [Terrilactibacillus tamarindi]MTT31691.1 phenylalanine--tRNA ligase subunit beta [Terrilactibacillus tamarindi]
MLVSYNWLKEYVDLTGVTPEDLENKITNAGIEVEHLSFVGEGITKVVVGYVESKKPHPEADKLNLCQVSLGDEVVQIVCGAPNVDAGQYVPVAKVGARLPGGVKIKRAKLRGEVSNGMICSLSELGVDPKFVPKEFADGIYVFKDEVVVGEDALPYLNLNDYILELDILPNSAHCLNMIGVAHEVAAILDREVKYPNVDLQEEAASVLSKLDVKITSGAEKVVPYYGARIITDIKIAPSPAWMQNRLIAAGIRPINNIVDISNYVMIEYGQPLHTFDYDTFNSDQVDVRLANKEEKITTLDGVERTLLPSDIVITNTQKAVAIAGVMGGSDTEVTSNTKTILLESALFDARSIRRTATRLNLRTDASSRYEKGLDYNRVTAASNRAASLIAEIAGGNVLSGFAECGQRVIEPEIINMPWKVINDKLGTTLTSEEIRDILVRLGFDAKIENEWMHVLVPTRRPDVSIPEDLVEEVGRIYGYDHLPATLPEGTTSKAELTPYQKLRRKLRRYFEGKGLYETVTYSLTTNEKAKQLTIDESTLNDAVKLKMPMSEEHETLRMSLVPGLIDVAEYHINRQMPNLAIYEIGKVFKAQGSQDQLPNEAEHISGLITGHVHDKSWNRAPETVDFFYVKGVLEGLFDLMGVSNSISYRPAKRPDLHPGRTATIHLNDECVGYIGQLHPNVQNDHDLNETYVFEISLAHLRDQDQSEITYHSLPRFPSITRDIALVVDQSVFADHIKQSIQEAGGKLLSDVTIFDVYEGEHIEEGKKSIAFSITYLDPERTLTDEEVSRAHDRVLASVKEKFDAVLRS